LNGIQYRGSQLNRTDIRTCRALASRLRLTMAPPNLHRILSLDGGGIRGVFSLQILARMEQLFREERRRPDLVLRDEFEFFAGTSTGAIIATCLAWGMSVAELERLYVERGPEMFAKAAWYDRWKGKYRATAIAQFFQQQFAEDDAARTPALLGTRRFHGGDRATFLLVVMRNATTGSPWPVTNNPQAVYNDPARPDCNLRIPLWKLLRASTAAPTYFPPESIELGARSQLFIDGGITPYNNPTLIAALMATLPCYRIGWPATPAQLMVVSVGTGVERTRLKKSQAEKIHLLDQATYVVPALLGSVAQEQDLLCRVLGECRFGAPLDSELGDLHGPTILGPAEKRFAYLRYNREFKPEETEALRRSTRQRFTLDNLALIPYLTESGRAYAAQSVQRQHFFAPA
jgi:uncharacterized protein